VVISSGSEAAIACEEIGSLPTMATAGEQRGGPLALLFGSHPPTPLDAERQHIEYACSVSMPMCVH
jgi:hypothetical protein